jgi:hypothetical protein
MQTENHATVTLTDLPRALRAYGVATSYQRCWRAVVAGDVPAQRDGSKWRIAEADLPVIADRLGLSSANAV